MLRDDDVRDEKLTSDNEGRGNSYDFGARVQDPRAGIFLSLDPLKSSFPWQSSYVFAGNNPIRFIDFMGMSQDDPNDFVGPLPETNSDGSLDFQGSHFINNKEGKWVYGTNEININSLMDKSTWNHNIFWNNYMGPGDPRTINKKLEFTVLPANKADKPPLGHDKRFRNIGYWTKDYCTWHSFLTDKRTIGADFQFVFEEFQVAINPNNNSVERFQAISAGLFIGIFAIPKTLIQLNNPMGIFDIWYYYNLSNKEPNGTKVDNSPYIHNYDFEKR